MHMSWPHIDECTPVYGNPEDHNPWEYEDFTQEPLEWNGRRDYFKAMHMKGLDGFDSATAAYLKIGLLGALIAGAAFMLGSSVLIGD